MQTQITPHCTECGLRCDIYPHITDDNHSEWHSTCCDAYVESSLGYSYEWGALQNYYFWCQSFEIDTPIDPNLED